MHISKVAVFIVKFVFHTYICHYRLADFLSYTKQMFDRGTSLDREDAILRYEAIENFLFIYLHTTPTNYLPTAVGIYLSADYPNHGQNIFPLHLFDKLSSDYPD